MADDKKKIIKRFELFTPPDSIEQYLIFSMSLNLDSLNNIFKTNKHTITTISELWNQDEIQKLIHESHKEVLDCIKDVEYEFGKSEELEKIRIEFEDENLFSAFIDQMLKRVLIMKIINDLLSDLDGFYDEKICEILENQNVLKESIFLNKQNLINEVKNIAKKYSSSNNNETIN